MKFRVSGTSGYELPDKGQDLTWSEHTHTKLHQACKRRCVCCFSVKFRENGICNRLCATNGAIAHLIEISRENPSTKTTLGAKKHIMVALTKIEITSLGIGNSRKQHFTDQIVKKMQFFFGKRPQVRSKGDGAPVTARWRRARDLLPPLRASCLAPSYVAAGRGRASTE